MEAFNPSLFNPQWLHGQNGHDATTPSHDASAVVHNGQDAQVAAGDDWNKHIDLSDFGLSDLHGESAPLLRPYTLMMMRPPLPALSASSIELVRFHYLSRPALPFSIAGHAKWSTLFLHSPI